MAVPTISFAGEHVDEMMAVDKGDKGMTLSFKARTLEVDEEVLDGEDEDDGREEVRHT